MKSLLSSAIIFCTIVQAIHGVILPKSFASLFPDDEPAVANKKGNSKTKCDAWPTQPNFEAKRFFNGKLWYVVASHFDTGAVCTTENLTWTDEFSGTGHGEQIQSFASGSKTNLTFELDRNGLQNAIFYYPYTVKTFLVVDTDYDNYAVVADCAEDWQPQPQAVSIYSRNPKMPDNYSDLQSKLVELGYDVKRLISWSVSGC